MSIYHQYAPFYDGSGQLRFAVLIGQYLSELLARHPVAGRRALDLACGTGTLAQMLAEMGWDVVGLDRSEPMLACARAKAEAAGLSDQLVFVQGDLRDVLTLTNDQRPTTNEDMSDVRPSSFVLRPSSFDLVTCTYDSLNYLLDAGELAACFDGVAQMLAPGGLFFADMNTRHFLEHDWGTCEVVEQPGFVQVTRSHFDSATDCSTMVLTGFSGDDARGYERFDEIHVERAYAPELVADQLVAAGLQVEATYDCFTFQPVEARTQRIAWIARRNEGVNG
jgi:SAM-dependent methyltransferase